MAKLYDYEKVFSQQQWRAIIKLLTNHPGTNFKCFWKSKFDGELYLVLNGKARITNQECDWFFIINDEGSVYRFENEERFNGRFILSSPFHNIEGDTFRYNINTHQFEQPKELV